MRDLGEKLAVKIIIEELGKMNKVELLGRLTKDVEMRTTTKGKSVARFTLAVNRRFAKPDDEIKADFFNVVVWNKTAEICEKYLAKGGQVCIVGTVHNRSWEDNDGNKKYITEIIADEVHFCGQKAKKEEVLEESGEEDLPF